MRKKKYYVVGTASIRARVVAQDSAEAKAAVKLAVEACNPAQVHVAVCDLTAIPKGLAAKEEPGLYEVGCQVNLVTGEHYGPCRGTCKVEG